MSADEPDLQPLRAFLEDFEPFKRHIYRLRAAPFHAARRGVEDSFAEPLAEDELARPERFQTRRSLRFAHWMVGVSAAALLASVAMWAGAHLPVLEFLLGGGIGSLTKAAAWGVVGSVVLLAEGGILTLIAERSRCVPDPLFARLLAERLHAPEPVPNRLIRALFADVRFPAILRRALAATLPRFKVVGEGWENTTEDVEVHREGQTSVEAAANRADWDDFLDRLFTALPEDHGFLGFFAAHQARIEQGTGLKELYRDEGLGPVLLYATRGLFFRTLLDDPDTLFVLSDCLRFWRRASLWLSRFDLKQLKDLLPAKAGGSGRVADARQLAYVGGLVALLLLLLRGAGLTFDFGRQPTPPTPACADCKAELSRIADRINDLIAAIRNAPPPPPITVSGAPVTINPPAAPAAAATPVINQISAGSDTKPVTVTFPAELHLMLDFTSKKVGGTPDPAKPPAAPPATAGVSGGDDFLTFRKGRSDSAKLRVQMASGKNCYYSAQLDPASPWPPRPVKVLLTPEKENPGECAPAVAQKAECTPSAQAVAGQASDATAKEGQTSAAAGSCYFFFAGEPPMYSELLHAYSSAAEVHRGFWIFARDRTLLVRVHVQAPPMNWQTISGPN